MGETGIQKFGSGDGESESLRARLLRATDISMWKFLITTFMISCLGFMLASDGRGCSRISRFTIEELFSNSEIIVRATTLRYDKPPDNLQFTTTGEPDSTVLFTVEETLRGGNLPQTIVLNGYLSDDDDFNTTPVPYMFVRPSGGRGSCFANTYKGGAQFLLFLKKTKTGYTSNVSALGPTNEQLHSDNDEWISWVREHLKSLKQKEGAAPKDEPVQFIYPSNSFVLSESVALTTSLIIHLATFPVKI